MRISTNVESLAAQRALNINKNAQQSSLEKMASGNRINCAADDAAGLSISEKMRAGVRSTLQAIRNASDGVSMLQTAEGALNETSNILVRFRELAIQAASDTLSDTERAFVNREVQQLKAEIGRIAETTEYNGLKLLASRADIREIQVGTTNDPDVGRFYFDVLKANMSPQRLKIESISVATKDEARNHLVKIDNAISIVSETRAGLGALQNRLESSINYMRNSSENASAARSRIKDTDYAMESAELTKSNLLMQSSLGVLAQANQSGAVALKLVE